MWNSSSEYSRFNKSLGWLHHVYGLIDLFYNFGLIAVFGVIALSIYQTFFLGSYKTIFLSGAIFLSLLILKTLKNRMKGIACKSGFKYDFELQCNNIGKSPYKGEASVSASPPR